MPLAGNALCGLMGGLALFLYGMHIMSRALEKAAGDRMRRVLAALTRGPLTGALAGAAATAALQSSSAVTVMVIGFVGAGLLDLARAVPVIFGANVGTTATGQLLALPLGRAAGPLLLASLAAVLLSKGERTKNTALALFGFALLFHGVEQMGAAMGPLANSPFFLWLMAKTSDAPLLGVGAGALMTVAVQSSSAALAVLQRFAAQAGPDGVTSVLGLSGAVPILLGSNIGTTVTALIAAAGGTKDEKRAALAHTLFNLTGALACLPVLPAFTRLVARLSPAGPETAVIARQIANAHTLFNLACTALWLPFTPLMVRLVTAAVPDRERRLRPEGYKSGASP